jgi:hypothetical protein
MPTRNTRKNEAADATHVMFGLAIYRDAKF